MKRHSDSTLMHLTKAELLEYVRMAEYNQAVAETKLRRQAEKLKDWEPVRHGHCAYCGEKIAYKDMQVDHFMPYRAWEIEDPGTDDLENLMPACRTCNHYKRAHTLETFRRYIQEIPKKLRQNYIYKVGLKYGNVTDKEIPIVFYFEKIEAQKNGGGRNET